MATEVLYVRVSPTIKKWLADVAENSNMTLSQVCEALLNDQRNQGVTSIEVYPRIVK